MYFEPSPASPVIPGSYSTAIAQGAAGGLPLPDASMVGKYARVTDLFGEKTDLVLCSNSGASFFWQPVRPFWASTVGANANMTLSPLRSPSLLRLTGGLTANRTLTLDTTYAWPGCQFEIAFDGGLGLFGLNIIGLDLGSTLSLLAGGRRRMVYDGSAFQTY